MLVTVIIPVFNCADHVSKAIQSILEQTYPHLQILILNDGSTDGSDAAIKRFSDPRIQYVSFVENTGKIGIVNKALSLAEGKLIAFQDADDWSDKTRIEKQVNAFTDPKLSICFTGYSINGIQKPVNYYRITDDLLRDEFHKGGFLNPGNFNPTVCATMMFKSTLLPHVNGYDEWFKGRVGEDLHLAYRLMKYGKALTIPEDLYFYNYNRPGSFTFDQLINGKPESLYSFVALSRLIQQDLDYGNDILKNADQNYLLKFELDACKVALGDCYAQMNRMKSRYENSTVMRVGRYMLYPLTLIRALLLKISNR